MQMSAFVVSHDHIDALLSFAKDKRMKDQFGYYIQPSKAELFDWTDIGRVLLAENERSVCHRYPDCGPGNMPGKIGEDASGYTFRYFEPFVHMGHMKRCVWVIKNCDCFDYQACETDDYRQTVAHRIIAAIRSRAINGLPDYETAPWGIDRNRSAA
jgi:hypothetical protein